MKKISFLMYVLRDYDVFEYFAILVILENFVAAVRPIDSVSILLIIFHPGYYSDGNDKRRRPWLKL